MWCSQLSQERLKLWTSNLTGTFAGSLRAKGHKNFGDKGAWAYQGLPNFLRNPISSGTLKATNFKFGRNIRTLNPSKRPLKILETRGRGRSQGLTKIFRARYTPCLQKNSQNCFHQNFVKFPPTLIIFGTRMAKTMELCKVHSFSTSPNLCQCTTA